MPGLLLIGIARGWQLGPSRLLPPTCRFTPSCSQYAIEAVRGHGAIKGGLLALWRLLRCQPWGGHGYDPVPEKTDHKPGGCCPGQD
ncbi:membrane protein insertion efficiency factor YidD [Novosphingobium colocasiae]|uniref:membrane protein insertion efficiency factor YidD n=1 Tax=Novosphingobium colocasiae TaxID=1256513 RepID=UPI0035B49D54